MLPLTGKNVVVIGGSRGVGRRIVEASVLNGARVLAVARHAGSLQQLAEEVSGVEVLALDATDGAAPSAMLLIGSQFAIGGGLKEWPNRTPEHCRSVSSQRRAERA